MQRARKPAKKETAAQNAVQRFRDVGVQFAFNVLHTGVFQDVDVFALAKLHKERLESLASLREWP